MNEWDPIDDGIKPIAQALSGLANGNCPTIDEVRVESTSPLSVLTWPAFNEPGLGPGSGSASRREMVRGFLEFNVIGDTAREFDNRLQSVLDALRAWEDRVRHPVPSDWTDPDDPYDMETEERTGLSRRLWDAYVAVQDSAHATADYLERLVWMIRSRARKRVDGLTRTTAGLAVELKCSEGTITRWRRESGVPGRSGSDVIFDVDEAVRILEKGLEIAHEPTRRRIRKLLGTI